MDKPLITELGEDSYHLWAINMKQQFKVILKDYCIEDVKKIWRDYSKSKGFEWLSSDNHLQSVKRAVKMDKENRDLLTNKIDKE
jgi:Fe-S cluster biosynthesis and repair protein YggX